ncbi:MAG: guanylate kinase [Candidatus Bipolaricaulaceae bacterium]
MVGEFLPPGWGVQGGRGIALVVTGPSGAGKSSVIAELLRADPGLRFAVSATTRPRRPDEVDGRDYAFVTDREFDRMLADGELLEWTVYQGHRYGTPRSQLEGPLADGRDVVLNVEVSGALAVAGAGLRRPVVLVFLVPPSWEELARRIQARETESQAALRQRLAIARREVQQIHHFHYLVVNDRLEETASTLAAILAAERCRVVRCESE